MTGSIPESCPWNVNNVYHVFAQRRSGHHAIIRWLTEGLENTGVGVGFENDICRKRQNVKEVLGTMITANAVVINYEDVAYSHRKSPELPYCEAREYGSGAQHYDILVARDWYNLVASRMYKRVDAMIKGQYVPIQDMHWAEVCEQWAELVQIGLSDVHEDGMTFINYNEWVDNEKYRETLSARLGLVDPDTAMSQVAPMGRGSSFDGMSLDGNAQCMDVKRRWLYLHEAMVPIYRNVVTDSVISEMNTALFGFGQDVVLESLPG
jgi:hypothetical protein